MPVLASHIMQLVDKNHARFVRNIAKQKALDERLKELEQTVADKQALSADLDGQIADMQVKMEVRSRDATEYVMTDDEVVFVRSLDGEVTPSTPANEMAQTTSEQVQPSQVETAPQEYEYRPHGKDLTFVGQEFDHTPTGDSYTVWGLSKQAQDLGLKASGIVVETVNMGQKITTKELADKVAQVMQDKFDVTDVQIRSDNAMLQGGAGAIKSAFGAGGLAQNDTKKESSTQSGATHLEPLEQTQPSDKLNLPIVSTWDSIQADHDLQALIRQHDEKLTPACKKFIERYLMGKAFKSKIGEVVVNAKSKGKLVDRIRRTKALAIARIPEILLYGDVVQTDELNKVRHDDFVQFTTFERVLTFDEFTAKATLKVGKRATGQGIAYYLGASKEKAQYDDLNSESTSSTLKQQGVKSNTEPLDITSQNLGDVNYFEVILDSLQVEVLTQADEAVNHQSQQNQDSASSATEQAQIVNAEPLPQEDVEHQEKEKEPMNATQAVESIQPHPHYSQDDIDYLQSIINKAINLETVDYDRLIEIGEKDEADPLFEQVAQVMSDYEDMMSADIE